jgi:hypothetical protein
MTGRWQRRVFAKPRARWRQNEGDIGGVSRRSSFSSDVNLDRGQFTTLLYDE